MYFFTRVYIKDFLYNVQKYLFIEFIRFKIEVELFPLWSVFAAHKDQESLGAGLDDRAEELGEQQHHGSIKNLFSVLRVLVAGITIKCTEEKALIH